MDIYSFKPTYLYVKQHKITGKLYFGKTVRNPEIYNGSGKHWLRHITKHGTDHVETLWYCLFLDEESCTKFALNFSKQENIVESEEWLNMIPEHGLGGDMPGELSMNYGRKASEETRLKMKESAPKTHSDLHNKNVGDALRGITKSEDHCKKTSEATRKLWSNKEYREKTVISMKKSTAESNTRLANRQNYKELKRIMCENNMILGYGWHRKSDIWIDDKIAELSAHLSS